MLLEDLGRGQAEADEFFIARLLAVDLKAASWAGAIKEPAVPGAAPPPTALLSALGGGDCALLSPQGKLGGGGSAEVGAVRSHRLLGTSCGRRLEQEHGHRPFPALQEPRGC